MILRRVIQSVSLSVMMALVACGGGGGGAAPAANTPAATPATAGKLTISESYNTTSGDLDFAAATGTNSADTLNAEAICAIRLSKVKVGTSPNDFNVNLYFKQSDKSVVFVGIMDTVNLLAFNMTTDSDAEKAKIMIDTSTKTATFTSVLLRSNENAANKAKINGSLALIGSATAACGT